MESKLRITPACSAPSHARPGETRLLRAGLLATAVATFSCTSILGDFGDEVIPTATSTASTSASSTGGGGSGQGGMGGGGDVGGGGDAGGAGGMAGSGGAGGQGGGSTICPSGQGPTMALIPGVAGGDPYCMDSTEVTIAQYFQWLNTAPDTGNQDSVCKPWNAKFEPDLTGSCQGAPVDPAVAPNFPVVCVDWCDASAYCKGTGKRLCGKIGGGPNAFGAPADAAMSQWYRACSAGSSKTYPYGDQYNDAACVGDAYDGQPGFQLGSDQPQEAGTAPGCEGGYPGVYDLSGNVREWEDSCETTNGQSDKCHRRGGSFKENASALSCASQLTSARASTTIDMGFRCCAEILK